MESFTLPLAALDRSSLAQAGGKGANLGELLRAGFAVPTGFCLTTAAYRCFVERAGIQGRISDLLAGLGHADVETSAVESVGGSIRALFRDAEMPAEIAEAVSRAAAPFAGSPLAVRSSATAEDLPEASFAGQQDTFLNVVGEQALIDAVRRCWASLWTDRAIAYRQRNAIPHESVALAVVVQEMVPAEAAGVLFTANPVSGKRTEAVIDASLGLGEAVVSGAVSPDNYVVDKSTLSIRQRTLGAKQVQVVSLPEGGTARVEVASEEAARQALSDEVVRQLVLVGNATESHFGWPQDVEWAVAEGNIYVLQSRPITSLYPLPPRPRDERTHVYLSISSMQGMLEPLTPLGGSLFEDTSRWMLFGGDKSRSILHAVNGRLYIDATTLLRGPLGPHFARLVLPEIEPVVGRILRRMFAEGRFGQPGAVKPGGVLRFAWRYRRNLSFVAQRVLSNLARPARARRLLRTDVVPLLVEARRSLSVRPIPLGEQVPRFLQMYRTAIAKGLFFRLVTLVIPGVGSFKQAERLATANGLDLELLAKVRQGLRHNVTTTMGLDLWALAKTGKADAESCRLLSELDPSDLAARYRAGGLPPTLQKGMAEFLVRYGHRGVREIDVGMPRWAEDPSYLFGVLKNYLALEDARQAPDVHFARQVREAESAIVELQRQARRLPDGERKAAVLGFLLSHFREIGGLREAPKFYIMWLMQRVRAMFLDAGSQLTEQGRLERAEDVFFLTMPELESAGKETRDYRSLVVERRRLYQREMMRHRIPLVLTSEGEVFYGEALTSSEGALSGTGASPGVARGRARVIRDPIGAKLAPGEILVAPSTDPAWTPLFLTAGALVMEAGGMMSHGSIVAREYGIPAVVGVAEATSRLEDGEEIEVDGSQGTVRVLRDVGGT